MKEKKSVPIEWNARVVRSRPMTEEEQIIFKLKYNSTEEWWSDFIKQQIEDLKSLN